MDLYNVIKRPLFTEKGTALKEKENKIVVEVDRKANKIEIKKAIEEIFNVKVESINTLNVRSKRRVRGRIPGRTSASKKAFITLKKGEKLDFIEGV
ncbi:MAG: 50S ribosomal protein L23 [Thermodesulfovibrionales bacterium]